MRNIYICIYNIYIYREGEGEGEKERSRDRAIDSGSATERESLCVSERKIGRRKRERVKRRID